ncbi:MAG: DoxX family protein [Gemmatimonadaceae bacterium]
MLVGQLAGAAAQESGSFGAGLLVVRVIFGLIMAAHGSQKLLGWFGGHGLAGTAGFFESIGFRPGKLFAAVASVSEVAGGLLLAAGLFFPFAPALLVSVMIVAAGSVHWPNGLFAAKNGIEVSLMYGAMAFALALTGPGQYSLDTLIGLDTLWTVKEAWVVLGLAMVGGFANLGLRKATLSTAPAA